MLACAVTVQRVLDACKTAAEKAQGQAWGASHYMVDVKLSPEEVRLLEDDVPRPECVGAGFMAVASSLSPW